MTTPILEALVVAFLAATLASVTAGYIKRGLARVKRLRKLRKRPRETGESI
jgi:hypothetical protein